ncbi:MAG: hypothetical protein D6743_07640 [Calditrichaeota bacterium]|nr:MAG: hypothetical protein D6743_07640 [Calditrichota bacterium]
MNIARQVRFLLAGLSLVLSRPLFAQQFVGPHGYLTLEAEISDRDSVSRRGTFDLHHFNLLANFLLDSKARVFGEIEWEHGTDTDLDGPDSTSAGFVRVERAWLEYAFDSKLKLRFGKFLTPFGIYNEIHDAAPAYDTTLLPQSIYAKHRNPFGEEQRFYAKFAIGIQALGRVSLGGASLLYHALLSNGRGSNPFEQDDNANKALAARVLGEIPSIGAKVGYSFYTDRNGLAKNTRQTAHAWDLRVEIRRWRLSAELAHFRLGGMRGQVSRQIANAGYGEVAYHIFGHQTVLVRYDLFNPNTARGHDLETDLTVGTSIQVLPQVLTKAEIHFWRVEGASPEHFVQALASLAVVF